MGERDELIAKIVEAEWEMFQSVSNIGGRASCQDDRMTFEVNRTSQAISWSDATLRSYLRDLTEAKKNGRNLLTEKYARMMKSTSPLEYAAIEHLLPPLELGVLGLIDKIVAISLEWERTLFEAYPEVLGRGRPLYSSEDSIFVTSLETYLRGELVTYSLETLRLYYENMLNQQSQKVNGAAVVYDYVMKRHGFASLQDANEKLAAQR